MFELYSRQAQCGMMFICTLQTCMLYWKLWCGLE